MPPLTHPDDGRITDDPLMFGLLTEEFDAVYERLLAQSRVHLSDQTRLSVRRTIIKALEPRIREVKDDGARGAQVRGFDDFRSWISAEMRRMIEQFRLAGILDDLADLDDGDRTNNVNNYGLAA